MGFFSKVFKGIKKVFKKIGRAIKKVAMKVGKFMDKIGIVGQIAMSLLLPGLGEVLGAMAGTMMGSANAVVSGMGNFLNGAINIATKAGNVVKDIGKGIFKVVGKTIGATINSIPGGSKLTGFISDVTAGKLDMTGDTFLGKGGLFDTARSEVINIKTGVGDLFSKKTLTDTNVYTSALEKAKINEALDPSDLGDVSGIGGEGGAGGRSMFELDDPREQAFENLRKSGGTTAKEASLTNPREAYFDELRQKAAPDAVMDVTDTSKFVDKYGQGAATDVTDTSKFVDKYGKGAVTPDNIIQDPSLLAQQGAGKDTLGTKILNSDIIQQGIQKFKDKTGDITLGTVAKGVFKSYQDGVFDNENQETTDVYGRSFAMPDVDQYAVEGSAPVENFAGRIQIVGYNAQYQAPQSRWAQNFAFPTYN